MQEHNKNNIEVHTHLPAPHVVYLSTDHETGHNMDDGIQDPEKQRAKQLKIYDK